MYMNKKNTEILGMMQHLGHTGYLQKNKSEKAILTKSSIALNKLADYVHVADNIDYKINAIKKESSN